MLDSYTRPDGAEMVAVAPHCAVARPAAERLGLLTRQQAQPPAPSPVPAITPEFVPTEAQKRTIRTLAKLGNTSAAIAKAVGVPLATAKKYRSA
jgi:hypothetical protein